MKAQPQPAKQRHRWPQLLAAVWWEAAATTDLERIRHDSSAAAVPGLHDCVMDVLFKRLKKLEA